MSNKTSTIVPSSTVVTFDKPVGFVARYCFGGTAQKQGVPIVIVPYGQKAPDGSIASAETLIAPYDSALGGKPDGSEGWIAIERLAGAAIVYVVKGGRTEKAAGKAIASFMGDAVARMSDEEYLAFEEEQMRAEMERARAALRARRMAGA
jgi:hypothetical protein